MTGKSNSLISTVTDFIFKVPFMLVIGEKEMNENTVAVRSRKKGDMGAMGVDEFVAFADQQIKDLVLDN